MRTRRSRRVVGIKVQDDTDGEGSGKQRHEGWNGAEEDKVNHKRNERRKKGVNETKPIEVIIHA